MNKLGFISADFKECLRSSIDLLTYDMDQIKKDALSVAKKLHGKIPIIYSTDRIESVAVRLRQQINENSKLLCWHHAIPEMNHNELVGWRTANEKLAVVYLRNKDDLKRNQIRIEINKEIIKKYTSTIIEIYSKGNTLFEKVLYLVHIGDWISWYLSELQGVDAIEVKVIDYLKSELNKV
jgi:glucose/mannose-6-phosphate isomerase